MKNKKRLIIGCCCIVLVVLAIILVNFGHKMKYQKIARKAAERMVQREAEESDVKASKLKYLSTFYNKKSDLYRVSYYTQYDHLDKKENIRILIEVYIFGGSSKVETVSYTGYGLEFKESDVFADGHANEKIVEDEEGTWTRVD
ncbi:hypothetical protein [Lacrimispora sp.]|uniref:hypothetical protein n=1 Tax=Lacrimispora sp. TaxID=2719234 RepID=UPI0028AC696D|nr:hypothetical protein [Lacrimispora sp.]